MNKTLFIWACCYFLLMNVWEVTPNNIPESNTIKGIVTDEQGAPLPGSSVRLRGTALGAGTNARGEFSLTFRNEMKDIILDVSFTGYKSQSVTFNIMDKSYVRITLYPSDNPLEEIVVTGTRTEKALKNTPVLTRVVTSKDIERINPVDIQSILEYELPGIQFKRHHGSGLPEFTFQGMDGKYVLFLMDGERIAGEGAADNIDFTQFNVDEIERIEIIRGAMSTMYGSNALGGVVNIITKNADRPFTGNVSARYSNRDEQSYTASGGTKLSRFNALTTLTYRKKDAFDVKDRDTQTVSLLGGYENWQFSQKLGYNFTDKLSGDIKGTLYDNRRIRANKSDKTQTLMDSYSLLGHVRYVINSNHFLNISYNFDNYEKRTDYMITGRKKKRIIIINYILPGSIMQVIWLKIIHLPLA